MQKLQLFAWNAAARGNDVHVNANPTQGQLLHSQYLQKKEELKDTTKVSILAKYGGEEYLEKAPKELLQGQTEEYVEYSRTGQVVKGKERAKTRSKYPEDGKSAASRCLSCALITLSSVCEQPHCGVGFVVRPCFGDVGLRMLSLLCAHVLLYRRCRHRCCPRIKRKTSSGIVVVGIDATTTCALR